MAETLMESKANQTAIPSVINALNSTSTTNALSAAQGKALNEHVANVSKLTELTKDKGYANSVEQVYAYRYGKIVSVCGQIVLDGATYTTDMPILVLPDSLPKRTNNYFSDQHGEILRVHKQNNRAEFIFSNGKQIAAGTTYYCIFNITYVEE